MCPIWLFPHSSLSTSPERSGLTYMLNYVFSHCHFYICWVFVCFTAWTQSDNDTLLTLPARLKIIRRGVTTHSCYYWARICFTMSYDFMDEKSPAMPTYCDSKYKTLSSTVTDKVLGFSSLFFPSWTNGLNQLWETRGRFDWGTCLVMYVRTIIDIWWERYTCVPILQVNSRDFRAILLSFNQLRDGVKNGYFLGIYPK